MFFDPNDYGMKRIMLLILFILLGIARSWGTGQVAELIIYEGDTLPIRSLPLEIGEG